MSYSLFPLPLPATCNKTIIIMAYDEQAFEEAMDDVHTRFILNLPDEELSSSDRIFFQLEQAWWFYDDFICDANTDTAKKLPRFKHMKPFSLAMFNFSPLLKPMLQNFDKMYEEFSNYKRSISTYGTILLNLDGTKIALCRNWKGKSWTLPGGKVNQNESGKDAAARETYEETGFDPNSEKGLCGEWKERRERGEAVEELILNYHDNNIFQEEDDDEGLLPLPWEPLQDEDKLVYTEKETNKRRTCYVCRGVPENFPFQPVARKEVGEVAWHDINSLPKNHYAVMPFMGQLKRWIKRDNKRRGIKNRDESRALSRSKQNQTPSKQKDYPPSSPRRSGSTGKRDRSRGGNTSRSGSRGREVQEGDKLIESGLATPGQSDRWTEEDMFATNERILGKKYTYDGNPHDFAEKGFDVEGLGRIDPHHFRVVGGEFMNSSGRGAALSAPPDALALQPLVYRSRSRSGASSNFSGASGGDRGNFDENDEDDDDFEFTPFFSDDGKAPWEDGVSDILPPVEDNELLHNSSPPPVRSAIPTQSNSKGLALLNQLRQGRTAADGDNSDSNINDNVDGKVTPKPEQDSKISNTNEDDWFITDREITARSQMQKLSSPLLDENSNEHFVWMKQWVQSLQTSPATKDFGSFRFDVDAIMKAMTV